MTAHCPLNVLTLNTWGIPYAADYALRTQALAATLARSDLDVVCLQEVWTDGDVERLTRAAHAGGLAYAQHFPSGVMGSGLLTLSRYPIIDVDFYRYRLGGTVETIWHGDYIAGKGVGLVRIQTPGGMLDVYNTHAIAQYHPDPIDAYRAHRAAQLYEATRYITAETTTNPLIFCGDFNVRADHLGYMVVRMLLGLDDVWFSLYPDKPGATSGHDNPYHHSNQAERIDYIFMRGGQHSTLEPLSAQVSMRRIPGTDIPYSDHYGVLARFDLQPAVSAPALSASTVEATLQILAETLSEGLAAMNVRRQTNIARFMGGLGALVPAHLISNRLWPVLRPLPVAATLGYTITRGLLAYIFNMDERNALRAVANEVDLRLRVAVPER
jgi:sphingomyelin phosphodiesterase 2